MGIVLFFISCHSQEPESKFDFNKVLWTISSSPDRAYIATGGDNDSLRIFSGTTYEELKTLPLPYTITHLAWHPAEPLLAIARQAEFTQACILDMRTYEFRYLDSLKAGGSRAIGWNHDGSILALGDNGGLVSFFSKTGELMKKESMDPKAVIALDWHPHQNSLVTVGSRLSVYNLDKDSLFFLQTREVEVLMLCVDWHPSGEFFVTGDYGDTVIGLPALQQFWDPMGKPLMEIDASKAEYRSIAWNIAGDHLASASDALRIWNKKGELLHTAQAPELLWGLDWHQGNILTTSGTGRIVLWNSEGELLREIAH